MLFSLLPVGRICYTVNDMANDAVSNVSTLKTCPVFRGFSDSGFLMMAKIARERKIQQGTPIFVQDMEAESMFIVQLGVVKLSIKSAEGKDHPLDKLAPGDAFGELSLIIGGHRLVTATAETNCEILEIPRRDFAKLQKQKPQACLKLMINIVNQFGSKLAACKDYLGPLLVSQLKG
jgi:CRP/FNR family transcriptional regulator, cyclic AMP receptor protein